MQKSLNNGIVTIDELSERFKQELHTLMEKLQTLQNEIADWSDETFGKNNSLTGIIRHLKEEVDHLNSNPYDPIAQADVYILLLTLSRKTGFTINDVCVAVESKHKINVAREWQEPDLDGVIRHSK